MRRTYGKGSEVSGSAVGKQPAHSLVLQRLTWSKTNDCFQLWTPLACTFPYACVIHVQACIDAGLYRRCGRHVAADGTGDLCEFPEPGRPKHPALPLHAALARLPGPPNTLWLQLMCILDIDPFVAVPSPWLPPNLVQCVAIEIRETKRHELLCSGPIALVPRPL